MNILKQGPGSETGGEADSEKKNDSVISMTQEQFDEVIASRLTRQEKKLKEEHESALQLLKEQSEKRIPTDENELSIRLKEREETLKEEYQLAIEKQAEETAKTKLELERLREENRVSVMQNEVVSVLSLTNAISPNDVWLILHSKRLIGVDREGNVVPVNPSTGEPLVSENGTPMELSTFIEGYLSERPHYVNPSGNRGSGGAGGRITPESGGSIANGVRDLYKDGNFQQLEAEMRSKGKLWHGGVIPDWDK